MKRSVLCACALALLLATPAWTCHTPQITLAKWLQPPDCQNGINVPSDWDEASIVADDWLCENGLPVTDIHWWGSYLGWCPETGLEPGDSPPWSPPTFALSIWSNDVNHPGALLWFQTVQPEGEEFVCEEPSGELKFRYFVDLRPIEAAFRQEAGQTYWLSIATYGWEGVVWGWETSSTAWNNKALLGSFAENEGTEWTGGEPFCRNMAFELTTIPIPGAVWLLGAGLIGLAGRRRK